MNEALNLIDRKKARIKDQAERIELLEFMVKAMGGALMTLAFAFGWLL